MHMGSPRKYNPSSGYWHNEREFGYRNPAKAPSLHVRPEWGYHDSPRHCRLPQRFQRGGYPGGLRHPRERHRPRYNRQFFNWLHNFHGESERFPNQVLGIKHHMRGRHLLTSPNRTSRTKIEQGTDSRCDRQLLSNSTHENNIKAEVNSNSLEADPVKQGCVVSVHGSLEVTKVTGAVEDLPYKNSEEEDKAVFLDQRSDPSELLDCVSKDSSDCAPEYDIVKQHFLSDSDCGIVKESGHICIGGVIDKEHPRSNIENVNSKQLPLSKPEDVIVKQRSGSSKEGVVIPSDSEGMIVKERSLSDSEGVIEKEHPLHDRVPQDYCGNARLECLSAMTETTKTGGSPENTQSNSDNLTCNTGGTAHSQTHFPKLENVASSRTVTYDSMAGSLSDSEVQTVQKRRKINKVRENPKIMSDIFAKFGDKKRASVQVEQKLTKLFVREPVVLLERLPCQYEEALKRTSHCHVQGHENTIRTAVAFSHRPQLPKQVTYPQCEGVQQARNHKIISIPHATDGKLVTSVSRGSKTQSDINENTNTANPLPLIDPKVMSLSSVLQFGPTSGKHKSIASVNAAKSKKYRPSIEEKHIKTKSSYKNKSLMWKIRKDYAHVRHKDTQKPADSSIRIGTDKTCKSERKLEVGCKKQTTMNRDEGHQNYPAAESLRPDKGPDYSQRYAVCSNRAAAGALNSLHGTSALRFGGNSAEDRQAWPNSPSHLSANAMDQDKVKDPKSGLEPMIKVKTMDYKQSTGDFCNLHDTVDSCEYAVHAPERSSLPVDDTRGTPPVLYKTDKRGGTTDGMDDAETKDQPPMRENWSQEDRSYPIITHIDAQKAVNTLVNTVCSSTECDHHNKIHGKMDTATQNGSIRENISDTSHSSPSCPELQQMHSAQRCGNIWENLRTEFGLASSVQSSNSELNSKPTMHVDPDNSQNLTITFDFQPNHSKQTTNGKSNLALVDMESDGPLYRQQRVSHSRDPQDKLRDDVKADELQNITLLCQTQYENVTQVVSNLLEDIVTHVICESEEGLSLVIDNVTSLKDEEEFNKIEQSSEPPGDISNSVQSTDECAMNGELDENYAATSLMDNHTHDMVVKATEERGFLVEVPMDSMSNFNGFDNSYVSGPDQCTSSSASPQISHAKCSVFKGGLKHPTATSAAIEVPFNITSETEISSLLKSVTGTDYGNFRPVLPKPSPQTGNSTVTVIRSGVNDAPFRAKITISESKITNEPIQYNKPTTPVPFTSDAHFSSGDISLSSDRATCNNIKLDVPADKFRKQESSAGNDWTHGGASASHQESLNPSKAPANNLKPVCSTEDASNSTDAATPVQVDLASKTPPHNNNNNVRLNKLIQNLSKTLKNTDTSKVDHSWDEQDEEIEKVQPSKLVNKKTLRGVRPRRGRSKKRAYKSTSSKKDALSNKRSMEVPASGAKRVSRRTRKRNQVSLPRNQTGLKIFNTRAKTRAQQRERQLHNPIDDDQSESSRDKTDLTALVIDECSENIDSEAIINDLTSQDRDSSETVMTRDRKRGRPKKVNKSEKNSQRNSASEKNKKLAEKTKISSRNCDFAENNKPVTKRESPDAGNINKKRRAYGKRTSELRDKTNGQKSFTAQRVRKKLLKDEKEQNSKIRQSQEPYSNIESSDEGDNCVTENEKEAPEIPNFVPLEGKDSDDLPTILPPKRRRSLRSNPSPMMIENPSERIAREFPRHNWLENKYNSLKNSKMEETGIEGDQCFSDRAENPEKKCDAVEKNNAVEVIKSQDVDTKAHTTENAENGDADKECNGDKDAELDGGTDVEMETTEDTPVPGDQPLDLCLKKNDEEAAPDMTECESEKNKSQGAASSERTTGLMFSRARPNAPVLKVQPQVHQPASRSETSTTPENAQIIHQTKETINNIASQSALVHNDSADHVMTRDDRGQVAMECGTLVAKSSIVPVPQLIPISTAKTSSLSHDETVCPSQPLLLPVSDGNAAVNRKVPKDSPPPLAPSNANGNDWSSFNLDSNTLKVLQTESPEAASFIERPPIKPFLSDQPNIQLGPSGQLLQQRISNQQRAKIETQTPDQVPQRRLVASGSNSQHGYPTNPTYPRYPVCNVSDSSVHAKRPHEPTAASQEEPQGKVSRGNLVEVTGVSPGGPSATSNCVNTTVNQQTISRCAMGQSNYELFAANCREQGNTQSVFNTQSRAAYLDKEYERHKLEFLKLEQLELRKEKERQELKEKKRQMAELLTKMNDARQMAHASKIQTNNMMVYQSQPGTRDPQCIATSQQTYRPLSVQHKSNGTQSVNSMHENRLLYDSQRPSGPRLMEIQSDQCSRSYSNSRREPCPVEEGALARYSQSHTQIQKTSTISSWPASTSRSGLVHTTGTIQPMESKYIELSQRPHPISSIASNVQPAECKRVALSQRSSAIKSNPLVPTGQMTSPKPAHLKQNDAKRVMHTKTPPPAHSNQPALQPGRPSTPPCVPPLATSNTWDEPSLLPHRLQKPKETPTRNLGTPPPAHSAKAQSHLHIITKPQPPLRHHSEGDQYVSKTSVGSVSNAHHKIVRTMSASPSIHHSSHMPPLHQHMPTSCAQNLASISPKSAHNDPTTNMKNSWRPIKRATSAEFPSSQLDTSPTETKSLKHLYYSRENVNHRLPDRPTSAYVPPRTQPAWVTVCETPSMARSLSDSNLGPRNIDSPGKSQRWDGNMDLANKAKESVTAPPTVPENDQSLTEPALTNKTGKGASGDAETPKPLPLVTNAHDTTQKHTLEPAQQASQTKHTYDQGTGEIGDAIVSRTIIIAPAKVHANGSTGQQEEQRNMPIDPSKQNTGNLQTHTSSPNEDSLRANESGSQPRRDMIPPSGHQFFPQYNAQSAEFAVNMASHKLDPQSNVRKELGPPDTTTFLTRKGRRAETTVIDLTRSDTPEVERSLPSLIPGQRLAYQQCNQPLVPNNMPQQHSMVVPRCSYPRPSYSHDGRQGRQEMTFATKPNISMAPNIVQQSPPTRFQRPQGMQIGVDSETLIQMELANAMAKRSRQEFNSVPAQPSQRMCPTQIQNQTRPPGSMAQPIHSGVPNMPTQPMQPHQAPSSQGTIRRPVPHLIAAGPRTPRSSYSASEKISQSVYMNRHSMANNMVPPHMAHDNMGQGNHQHVSVSQGHLQPMVQRNMPPVPVNQGHLQSAGARQGHVHPAAGGQGVLQQAAVAQGSLQTGVAASRAQMQAAQMSSHVQGHPSPGSNNVCQNMYPTGNQGHPQQILPSPHNRANIMLRQEGPNPPPGYNSMVGATSHTMTNMPAHPRHPPQVRQKVSQYSEQHPRPPYPPKEILRPVAHTAAPQPGALPPYPSYRQNQMTPSEVLQMYPGHPRPVYQMPQSSREQDPMLQSPSAHMMTKASQPTGIPAQTAPRMQAPIPGLRNFHVASHPDMAPMPPGQRGNSYQQAIRSQPPARHGATSYPLMRPVAPQHDPNVTVSGQGLSMATEFNLAVPRACHACMEEAPYVCSGCKRVWYCTPDCQRRDWDRHGKECQ